MEACDHDNVASHLLIIVKSLTSHSSYNAHIAANDLQCFFKLKVLQLSIKYDIFSVNSTFFELECV